MPPLSWLAILIPVALFLALLAPTHVLLLGDLLLVRLQDGWVVAGIAFDRTDVLLFAIALGVMVRRPPRSQSAGRSPRVPLLRLWIILGTLLCLSYLAAPINRPNLTDPVRIAYQLYRYCWKTILFYPLTLILLNDRRRILWVPLAIVMSGDVLSLQGIAQGLAGRRSFGPFLAANTYAAALLIPLALALWGLVYGSSRVQRIFYGVSFVLLVRALVFSASRGAFVAAVLASSIFAAGLALRRASRSRLLRLVPLATVFFLALLALKPDLFQGPNLRRLVTASEGAGSSTFQWRLNERWPHFWRQIGEHPWLGLGTDVDPTLAEGDRALTPHNGYLSLAVTHGLPATAIILLFALLAMRGAVRSFRRAAEPGIALLALALLAGLVGVLTQNLVDGVLNTHYVTKLFWMLVALSILFARRPEALQPEGGESLELETEVGSPGRSGPTAALLSSPRS